MYIESEKQILRQTITAPEGTQRRGLRGFFAALTRRYAAYRQSRRVLRATGHLSDRLRADIGYPPAEDPAGFWTPPANQGLIVRANR